MGTEYGHDGGHDHGGERSIRKLGGVAAINLVGFAIELAGGLLFGSVALIGDAFHMLFDALAYVLAFGAAYVSRRAQPGEYWSYGLDRVEPFTAFLNGILLVPMVGYLVWESYQRYLDPVEIDPMMTAALATGGLLVNFGSVYYLQGGEMNLNEKGAFYHLLGDTGASVAVIVSMLVVEFTGSTLIDPITAVLIAVIIIWSAVKLLRESGEIFFQRSPVSVDEVENRLKGIEGVVDVGDVHIWQLSSTIRVASMHLTDDAASLEERERLKKQAVDVLHEEFDVDHATIDMAAEMSEYARVPEHQ
ncbi:MAG: cation diffusion facilitator family transporter [Halopenitus sp.]